MKFKNIRKEALLKVRELTGAAIVTGEMIVPDEKYMAALDEAKVAACIEVFKRHVEAASNNQLRDGASRSL